MLCCLSYAVQIEPPLRLLAVARTAGWFQDEAVERGVAGSAGCTCLGRQS